MDSDDIPIVSCLINKNKPKLKSFSFASNITSIFKNFEESESMNVDLNKPIEAGFVKINSSKRARTDSLEEEVKLEKKNLKMSLILKKKLNFLKKKIYQNLLKIINLKSKRKF